MKTVLGHSSSDVPVERIAHTQILACSPGLRLREAARRMQEERCSSIVVMDGDTPVGIWTERDALRLDFSDRASLDVPVSTVMSKPVKTVSGKVSVNKVGGRFKEEGVRHLLVEDDRGKVIGIVTQTDVILNQGVEHFLFLRDVGSALNRPLVVIPGTADLNEAARRMRESGVDAAVVTGAGDEEPGIVTERDLVRLIATRTMPETVGAVASRPMITVPHDSPLLNARDMLERYHVRHLGVTGEGGLMVGLLSFSDILQSVQYEYVHQLEAALGERDIALKRSERNLMLAHKVIEASLDGIMIVSAAGLIEMVNPAFTTLTGYDSDEVVGQNPRLLSSGRHDQEFYRILWDTLAQDGQWQGEIWNRRKNGEVFPEWLTITAIHGDDGKIQRYAAIFSDITERKKAEERIKNLAYFDVLTGLPNRRLFTDRLAVAMANAHRHEHRMAVMLLDLDMFKRINDTLGHSAGDRVLETVAQRLITAIREGDTVARLGGDEFSVLLPEVEQIDDAVRLARRIIEEIKQPLYVDGSEMFVTASIGISLYPDDAMTAEGLLKNADTAMYRAKDLGRNAHQLYSSTMNALSLERLAMETSLRHALARDEFLLAYQVKVNMGSGRLSGVEALIRWHHPELGVVPPSDFIPLAEANGLIGPIGEWVLHTACRQNREWQDLGLPPTRVAVNISARQFLQCDLVATVRDALESSNLDPRWLELEVTESAVMPRVDEAAAMLHELRAMGVHISIDDFGTGYSSLSHLKRLPIDSLKIDKTFVQDMAEDSDDVAIVSAIIAMAQTLRIRVIAEGVENEKQALFLRAQGCDEVQGYLIGRPVSPENLVSLFDRRLLPGVDGEPVEMA
ncbi:MAG: EAL domain-containing protein [Magnetospirillum sp. WYHS-4]